MHRLCLLLSLSILASPASAAPDWRQAREIEVLLSNLDIQPETISLKAGQPVRFRFVNNSHIPHSFSAGGFFGKAQYRNRDKQAIGDGQLTIAPGETREVVLIPAAGRYSASCGNLFHRVMGMRSRIVVE